MNELIEWFCRNYPDLKKLMQTCEHSEGDINPYHIEGDCWSHTMLVCKVAEIKGVSKVVQVASLLHDIGKPSSRKVKPSNNHVLFFGHEEQSAKIAKPILDKLAEYGYIKSSDIEYILDLIRYHGLVYKESIDELSKRFDQKFFCHLMQLGECDKLGRFHKI